MFNWVGDLLGKKTPEDSLEQGMKALGDDSPAVAEKHLARALEMAEESKNWRVIAKASMELGRLNESQGKNAVAETHYRKAFRTHEDSEEFEETGYCLILLGELYRKMHRTAECEQIFLYAINIYQQHFGAEDTRVAKAASCLANSSLDQELYEEAEKLLDRAFKILNAAHGKEHLETCDVGARLAVCYGGRKQFKQAQDMFSEVIANYEKLQAGENADTAINVCSCYHEFGKVYLAQKKTKEALPLLEKAMAVADRFPGYLREGELAEDIKKCQ